jgi:hypothetical protein
MICSMPAASRNPNVFTSLQFERMTNAAYATHHGFLIKN